MAGHGHSHGGHCEHESEEQPSDLGVAYSLYTKIDTENVQCLNEVVEESGKLVFKPWEKRLETDKFVESDVDEELLFNVPFTGTVKLKGIIVLGGEDTTHPSKMKLFKNRPNINFDDVNTEADEEFEMQPDLDGTLEYPVKVVKFPNVHHLTIYFPKNFGAERTKIYYIGLKGEYTKPPRQEITLMTYEAAPNPCDHKTEAFNPVPHQIR
ncbi:PITH domain-containing protein 1 [Araneus ventricosus]|uniref:PITH domain-containing protein 1 n=1 Tax=Araneus ventricosus TaxID=182803 RepID=A0A4Y2PQ99_ARAVE|nr:PITH domain-containing protein 1 [Araneus ventricosus]